MDDHSPAPGSDGGGDDEEEEEDDSEEPGNEVELLDCGRKLSTCANPVERPKVVRKLCFRSGVCL